MSIHLAKRLILILSLAGAAGGILLKNELISGIIAVVCALAAIGVLCSKLPELSNTASDSPQSKILHRVTVFNILFIIAIVIFAVLAEKGILLISERMGVLLMPTIFGVLILLFGRVAPKLPFNRYTGLRLPWTIRDEETWLLAHRLLGHTALPCGILCFAGCSGPRASLAIPIVMLLVWIGVPSVASMVFFYKKFY